MSGEEKYSEKASHVILQKPLPEILDEIVTSIQESEAAAADARKAAEEARLAGELAADAVMKKIRHLLLNMADNITGELKGPEKT